MWRGNPRDLSTALQELELISSIRKLYQEHHSTHLVAEILGINRNKVSEVVQDLIPEKPERDWNALKIQARELYKRYQSIGPVAKDLGIDPTTVHDYCSDLIAEKKKRILQLRQQARDLFVGGLPSSTLIGRKLGVPIPTVSQWIRDLVIAEKNRIRSPEEIARLKKQKIRVYIPPSEAAKLRRQAREMYPKFSPTKIAKLLNVGQKRIFEWLEDLIPEKDIQELKARARSLYPSIKSAAKVARKLKVHPSTVAKWVGDLMPERPKLDYSALKEEARKLYPALLSINKIADQLGMSGEHAIGTIHNWVKDLIKEKKQKMAAEAEQMRQEARRLYPILKSTPKVAKALGLNSHKTVLKWVADLVPRGGGYSSKNRSFDEM